MNNHLTIFFINSRLSFYQDFRNSKCHQSYQQPRLSQINVVALYKFQIKYIYNFEGAEFIYGGIVVRILHHVYQVHDLCFS